MGGKREIFQSLQCVTTTATDHGDGIDNGFGFYKCFDFSPSFFSRIYDFFFAFKHFIYFYWHAKWITAFFCAVSERQKYKWLQIDAICTIESIDYMNEKCNLNDDKVYLCRCGRFSKNCMQCWLIYANCSAGNSVLTTRTEKTVGQRNFIPFLWQCSQFEVENSMEWLIFKLNAVISSVCLHLWNRKPF